MRLRERATQRRRPISAGLLAGVHKRCLAKVFGELSGVVLGIFVCLSGWFVAFMVWVYAVWLLPLLPPIAN